MSAVEYSVIIERPLYEVLTQLDDVVDSASWKPGSPAGGLRFEAVASGTRVTVLGEGVDSAPNLLASLMRVFASQIFVNGISAS
jgi:hypothetical protein